jgi:hypothetical protein
MRTKANGLRTRSDVLPEIDVALEALSRPLTRQERKAGWSDESRIALRTHIEIAKARLLDPRPLQAEEFPPDWQTLRGLDSYLGTLIQLRLLHGKEGHEEAPQREDAEHEREDAAEVGEPAAQAAGEPLRQ